MNRTCKKCGRIDFDIWGNVGMIGFCLFISAIGYALAIFGFKPSVIILGVVFGLCLMVPMWMISFHEERNEE